MKKIAGDIILHMCTKNHNHMIYGSCDTEWEGENFYHFGLYLQILKTSWLGNFYSYLEAWQFIGNR